MFTKAIIWPHHSYQERLLNCQMVKTSAFSWPICQKHIRESYWSLPLDSLSSLFPASFFFFLLNWHPIKGIPFRCQQHVSTDTFHTLCFRFPLFIQRPLSWLYWQCRNLPVMLISLRYLFWGLLWAWICPWGWIPFEYKSGHHCMYTYLLFKLWSILIIRESYFILNL